MHFVETQPSSKFKILAPIEIGYDAIFTKDALDFFILLHEKFNSRRKALLSKRLDYQDEIDNGNFPDFLNETKYIRDGEWKIAPIPDPLKDRRVEITGPVDRKMIINALNSNVKVFMADFEDSNSPTWKNIINGQINLKDAVRNTITYTNPNGKIYKLNNNNPILMVRPRGWHLDEKHFLIDGETVSASIFDFAFYFFHNANTLIANGAGPYFYLPKIENYLEAQLWNDIFNFAQDELGIPRKTIKATVLIETILSAFQMDEILYELKDHSAGLNCGRWDYIFSFIKKFRNWNQFVLPDRSCLTMDRHFLDSYVKLLITTCHKRGAHAMGGMAAQIPIKDNLEANNNALNKVSIDKKREASEGHDGTWIAHPGLASIAFEAFDNAMPSSNQIHYIPKIKKITQDDLLKVPLGQITENGVRYNIKISLQYIEAWLKGNGCVPINHLMEDAATAEISRAQLWQWIKHKTNLNNDIIFTVEIFDEWLKEELENIKSNINNITNTKFDYAAKLLTEMIHNDDFDEFLTLPAYKTL